MHNLNETVQSVLAEICKKYEAHKASGAPHRWDRLPEAERKAKWAEEMEVRKQWGQDIDKLTTEGTK